MERALWPEDWQGGRYTELGAGAASRPRTTREGSGSPGAEWALQGDSKEEGPRGLHPQSRESEPQAEEDAADGQKRAGGVITPSNKSIAPRALQILSPGKGYYPISQIKKLRHREARKMAQGHTTTRKQAKLGQD